MIERCAANSCVMGSCMTSNCVMGNHALCKHAFNDAAASASLKAGSNALPCGKRAYEPK